MSRRQKLLDRMKSSPCSIRFSEVESLLRYEGFILFNSRGSHSSYHRADGRLLTLVRPHGGRKTCNPDDVRKVLEALAL